MHTYLSNIFAPKEGSMANLSDNGTEFKNTALNEAYNQLGIKRIFSNLFHLQGNSRIKNMHNLLKRTLTTFLESGDLEWNEMLPFAFYCYNIFPRSNETEPPFFLMFGNKPAEGCLTHLNNYSWCYGDNKSK